jgi:transcriptional regulator with XRE-family HTH domain
VSGDTEPHSDFDRHSDFGRLLRRRRLAAGLTQEELAERAKLSVRALRDLERGATGRPYRHSINRLADALILTDADRTEFSRMARRVRGEAGRRGGPRVPRQLPGVGADFTGRSAELKTLAGLLEADGGPVGTVVVSAIGGTAGVGKTALALTWARQITDRFPDGQLYVNLRGYDPGQPMPSTDALAGFLRTLGGPGQDIPADTGERAAAFRSLLAGRRMLVFLDNASSAEQVRPLLPATPDCVTVVTSRDTLAGLVARDGARRLDLDLLSPADADILLNKLIGDRAAADPEATAALAAACTRLPLTLRIAAGLAVSRPSVPLERLVAELAGEQQRLDAGGDSRTAAQAVFSWSYRRLDPVAARAFRLLSLHPGPDYEAYAAAALTGGGPDQASELLGELARAYLMHPTATGRYGQHDLLRAYARELAASQDGADETRAALTRLRDHYLHAAAELGATGTDEVRAWMNGWQNR